MNTAILLLLVTSVSQSNEPESTWRLTVAAGTDQLTSDQAQWIGAEATAPRIDVDRRLLDLIGSLWLHGALQARSGEGTLYSDLYELELGATFQLPADGFGGWIFPYARGGLLGGLLVIQADGMSVSSFVPGIAASLGVRLQSSGESWRWVGFLEGGWSQRRDAEVTLEAPQDESTKDAIAVANTPLGTLPLSGFNIRLGVGIEF